MLAKKRYDQHAIQGRTIPILFLSLVLISLNFSSISAGCGCCATTQTDVMPAGGAEIPWGEDISLPFTLSANSVIPLCSSGYMTSTGYICGYLVALEIFTLPDIKAVKWQLKNPVGKLVYEKDVTEDWKGFSSAGFAFVCVPDPEIKVPRSADVGTWTLTLMVSKSVLWFWEHTYELGRFSFNVGKSSIVDNLFAPNYLIWGGIMGQGAFSTALPGIFWLTSPAWILAIIFIMLAFYARSIRLAIALIKESGKRFKEAMAGKS